MKKDRRLLPELETTFSDQNSIRKSDLRAFYRERLDDFDENTFRRVFYALNQAENIVKVDSDAYVLKELRGAYAVKEREFEPVLSAELKSIHALVLEKFPYTKFCIWETRILSEFMVHQPARNFIVLNVEKDAIESVFNFLNEVLDGGAFLDPDRHIVENYVLRRTDSVIVVPMISRSPIQEIQDIAYARLEKILVDLVVDEGQFYMFHGRELVNIYEGAFGRYQVGERKLFWYAKRRHAARKVARLIREKTGIELITQGGAD